MPDEELPVEEAAESAPAEAPVESESPQGEVEPESAPEVEAAPEKEKALTWEEAFKHPRFKQLVEDRNDQRELNKDLEKRLEEVAQAQKAAAGGEEKDALMERLKEIDPEFGTWAEKQTSTAKELEQLREWREEVDAREANRVRADTDRQVDTKIASLYDEHKVPEVMQTAYRSEMEVVAREMLKDNPKLAINDLPEVFKVVHEKYSTFLEGMKRENLKNYASDKRGDGPASPRGTVPPAQAKDGEEMPVGMDPRDWIKVQIARSAVSKSRSDHDV